MSRFPVFSPVRSSILHALTYLMINDTSRKCITLCICNPFGDKSLDTLVRGRIAGGGILPFIHESLTAGKLTR